MKPTIVFWLLAIQLVLAISVFSQDQKTIKSYFASDKSTLPEDQIAELKSQLEKIDYSKISNIEVHAFCDDKGSIHYNQQLSSKRASHVKSLLIKFDIDVKLIKISSGEGEISLEESDIDSENQRQENRRAEILFSFKKENSFSISDDLKIGDKVVLKGILFQGGRHLVLRESIPVLEELVKTLNEYPNYEFVIQGHICCSPPNRDGLDKDTGLANLSEARAETIFKYLVLHGIDVDRLTSEGLKANYPLGKGDKFDRRVELKVSDIR